MHIHLWYSLASNFLFWCLVTGIKRDYRAGNQWADPFALMVRARMSVGTLLASGYPPDKYAPRPTALTQGSLKNCVFRGAFRKISGIWDPNGKHLGGVPKWFGWGTQMVWGGYPNGKHLGGVPKWFGFCHLGGVNPNPNGNLAQKHRKHRKHRQHRQHRKHR